jgi:NAD(P)H-hydrate epimerase
LVFLAGDRDRTSPDARTNLDAWCGTGGELRALSAGDPLSSASEEMARADVIVDALFGTGLDRGIEGWLAAVVRALNESATPRFAVDLPSGLDADTGATMGAAVEATVTVTFAHHKLGLLTPHGARLAGRVDVVDIGVPGSLSATLGEAAQVLDASDLETWTVPRLPGAHKTSAGHVLVVGGSEGKVGAPQLAVRGALRAGAGVATLATWPDVARRIESGVLEAMTAHIDPAAIDASLEAVLAGKHAVVLGPGLGLGHHARAVAERVLSTHRGPVVVDADALTLFAHQPGAFAQAKKAILTPHSGELARLLGTGPAQVEKDRFGAARELVAASGAVVVLKGAHTIVASPDGRLAISPIACPALATAGSGDVLAGVVGAIACTQPIFEAACAGVLLHALAGRAWSSAHAGSDRGLLASEIADAVVGIRRTQA